MDFLDQLDKEHNIVEEASKPAPVKEKSSGKSNNPVNQLWNKTSFEALKINTADFNKDGKTFMWYSYNPDSDLSDDVKARVKTIFNGLNDEGYTFRHTQSGNDTMITDIINVKDFKFESYLPWKNFNANVENAICNYGTEKAYRIASGYFKNFGNLPATIRAIKAASINGLLGKDCNDPVDFILVYTDTGDDKFHKDFKFDKNGDLAFYLKVCKDANIPLFNIKSVESLKNFKEFLQ